MGRVEFFSGFCQIMHTHTGKQCTRTAKMCTRTAKCILTFGPKKRIIDGLTGCSAVGSALGSGPRGPGFKSPHSDHKRALKKMPKRKALIYQGFSAFSGQVFQHRFYRCQTAKILYWQDLNPQIAKITPKGVWKVKIHTPFSFAQKHYSPLCFHTAIKY